MKKAILTIMLLGFIVSGFAQQCLFERTYNEGFMHLAHRSYPSEAVALGNGWLIVGYKYSCSGAYVMFIDCSGEVVWEYFAAAEHSTYTDLQKIDTLVYVSGVDLWQDDVTGETQWGFIDVFGPSGFQHRLMQDSLFPGGFGSVYVDSSQVVTIASTDDYGGIGYGVPNLNFGYLNTYNFSNPFPATSSTAIPNLKQALILDSTVIAVSGNEITTFKLDGSQNTGIAFPMTSSGLVRKHGNNAMAVVNGSTFSMLNTQLSLMYSHYITDVLDEVIDFQHYNGEWIFLGKKESLYRIAHYGASGFSLIDSFNIDVGCATPTDVAANDDNILVTGYEKIGENFRMFAKSFSHTGNNVSSTGQLSLLASSFSIDSSQYYYTIPLSNMNIVLYHVWLTANIEVINNGNDTIKSFCIYSDVIDYMNCHQGYLQRCYDSIAMGTGDTLYIDFHYIDYEVASSSSIQTNFYITGINDGLMGSCSPITSVQTMFVGINTPTLAESISVYPNPFTGTVSFTNLPYGATIGIYNLQGQQLATVANTDAVDLGHLSPGMYLYRITASNGSLRKTGKLVKE